MASDWTKCGKTVVTWAAVERDDDDDDDDDKTSMCIITGMLFIGTKFEKKIANPWPLIFIDLCMA